MKIKSILSFFSNDKMVFLVPSLISGYNLLYFYNSNVEFRGDILFYEIIVMFLVFLIINFLLGLFFNKALKDKNKTFFLLCFINFFYCFKFSLIFFLLFIVFVLWMAFYLKKFVKFSLVAPIKLMTFIIVILFAMGFVQACYNGVTILFKTNYDKAIKEIKVEDNTDTPNIYYIHCDGMLGLSAMRKYFGYRDNYLTNYFYNNDYYVNEDAELIAGHKTQRALVALYNPNYYDKVLKKYLYDLEDTYLGKKKSTSYLVGYYQLEEKRLNNELFNALSKKNYTTVGIGEFNQYTSLDTDYYYDFYYFDSEWNHLIEGKDQMKFISQDNSDLKKLSYIRFLHSRSLIDKTMFHDLVDDVNYLDHKYVDYNDLDLEDYEYINNSKYWVAKGIVKAVDETNDIDDNKFVFIDYNLNHLALTFDIKGNRLELEDGFNLMYYPGNYSYSTYILVDMLEYIKNNDQDAVIIVQGDHGIHMAEEDVLMSTFVGSDIEDVQTIRNSVISAMYIPDKYKNGDEKYLSNPLNIGRYIVNNYVGDNYQYID